MRPAQGWSVHPTVLSRTVANARPLRLGPQRMKLRVEHGDDRAKIMTLGGGGQLREDGLQVLAVGLNEAVGNERSQAARGRE